MHAIEGDAGAEAACGAFPSEQKAQKRDADATVERERVEKFLAKKVLRFQRVEQEEEDRKTELHAHEPRETRAGDASEIVGVEQLQVLSVRRARNLSC